ncbi:MAG: type II toxin-antitoxin system RelE/ParE family toxin [Bacteroidetes bacterium]|nr:type II toxin-antitoxin system RelE/ParE family toxin [Bacteroidota bacterium]
MKVKIDTSFERDVKKIKDILILKKLGNLITSCINAGQLQDINNCKKLNGFKNYYRIRLNDYRIGLRVENEELIFERILHRKEIYRFFP